MLIGVVGAPNKGKSTFFSAATKVNVAIADYPFTTIKPNEGIAFVRVPCVCQEFHVSCNPQNSRCVNGWRFVPVKLLDVAGLVPGAHEGRGLGNKFLDDLRLADALIQIVDASGSTDLEGRHNPSDPTQEVMFLRDELRWWVEGILRAKPRITEKEKQEILRGLKMKSAEDPKPIVVGANKIDLPHADEHFSRLRAVHPHVFPLCAAAEYALLKAVDKGVVSYLPGDKTFTIIGHPDEAQEKGLTIIRHIMEKYGGTGVQQILNAVVFDILHAVVVYPVENEHTLSDSQGNVLPHSYIMEEGSTVLDLARKVHSDLAENFIGAIDVRTKRKVGKDTLLKNGDVIKILAH